MKRRKFFAVSVVFLLGLVLISGCGGKGTEEAGNEAGKASSLMEFARGVDAYNKKTVTVTYAGDVNFGDGVTPYLTSNGVDYPWVDAGSYFESMDVGFVNLECCLSTTGSPVPGKEFCFRGPPDSAAGLDRAGVDVVSLANNHSKDYGAAAFLETFTNLKANGVIWCGAGNNNTEAFSPAVVDIRGQKVAFLAFTSIVPSGWPSGAATPGCATSWDPDQVSDVIKEASSECDYVVASFHWGVELDTSPNGNEQELAHLAVDSGADLVIGHHPHVVQGFELYKDKLIAYSLGNFIFSPPREISARTLLVVAVLQSDGLVQAKLVPMAISSCRPVQLTGGAAKAWIDTVAGYSKALGTDVSYRGGFGFIEGK